MKFAEKLSAVCMLAVGLVVAFSLDSCKKEPDEEPVTVEFPEAQTLNVQANTTETLHFTINADWILYSDSEWATFNDGELSASGGAGDVELALEISDLGQTLEETSTAYLTLSAGGEEHVIYTINRAPEGIEFSITDADGNEVTALTAGWQDYDYYTISANFVFAVSDENKPEWLETEDAVTNSESDPCTAGFKVVDDVAIYKYSQSGKITFANEAGTLSYEYDITFPGMDYDDIEILESAGQWNWEVNNTGEIVTHNGEEADPTFTFAALNDDYVIVVADYTLILQWAYYVDTKYDESGTWANEDASWIHVAKDDGKGAVTLSFDSTTSERYAFVFAFSRAYYEELSEGKFAALYDDEGDIEAAFDYFVIADVKQTTKSGEEHFRVKDGTDTEKEYDVSETCPEGLDVTSVLADYPDAYVGYLPYEVGPFYITTVWPFDYNGDWICASSVTDCNGNSCYDLTDYYSFEGGQDYHVGDGDYYSLSFELKEDPDVKYFYIVYHDPDDDDCPTWILFCYNLNASEDNGSGSDESGILVQYVDENGVLQEVTVETTCPVTLNKTYGQYCYDDADFLEDYPTDVVGYIPFKEGVTYITTLKPLNTESTWISDYFFVRSCMDDSLYGYYTDPSDMDDYEGVGFKTGSANNTGYTASDGTKYPSADIQCISFPTGSYNSYDFYVLGYRQTSSFTIDSYDGLLFIYPTEGDDNPGSEEEGVSLFAIDGVSLSDLGVIEDTYSGVYSDFISEVKSNYNVAGEGYIKYATSTDYIVGVASKEEWATEPAVALDYYEKSLYEQSGTYDIEAGQSTQYNGASVYGTDLYLNSDPECLFYFVWTDEDGNSYILFFYNDTLPSEGDEGYAIAVQDINNSYAAVEVYDECPIEITFSDKWSSFDAILSEYEDAVVGYVPFTVGTKYATTITPVSSSSSWLSNFLAYDNAGSYLVSGKTDVTYVSISAGTSYSGSYTSIDVDCVEAMPSNVDFAYIVYRNEDNDAVAVLILYATDKGSSEETEWVAVPSDETTEWGESVWSGLSSEYGTDAVEEDFLYSDGYLNFLNGGGSGFKFAATSGTYRVQLAGSGSTSKCCIQFKVTTNGTISVSAGTSSSGSERTLLIYAGDTEITNEADAVSETTATTFTHSVTDISGETIISICSKSSGINVFDIQWTPGEGGEEVTPEETPLVYEFSIPSDDTEIKLNLAGTIDATVDWGDGSTETVTSAAPTHTYSAAGTYEVSITGTVTQLTYHYVYTTSAQNTYLTKVKSWGDVGLTNLQYAFYECVALTEIPSDATGLKDVTTFNYAFQDCTALATLSSDSFSTCSKVTDFSYAFYGCTSLTDISADLFKGLTAVTTFNYVFYNCAAITEIPSGLFDYNTEVTSFQYAFTGTSITTLPGKLFKNCSKVTTFAYLCSTSSGSQLASLPGDLFEGEFPDLTNINFIFKGNTSLTTVDPGIFDYFTTKISCMSIFNGCTSLEGESPYTMIEGEKVHLYERDDTGGYPAITSHTAAFSSCTKLTDYYDIPSNWGGGGN